MRSSSSLDGGGLSPEAEMFLDAFLDSDDESPPPSPSQAVKPAVTEAASPTSRMQPAGFDVQLRQRGPALVCIHGFLGWGETRPLWGMGPTYYPLRALRRRYTSGPVVAVDVGVASSSHDRACEAFAQLVGIRCDYGEEHARAHGHCRFGPDFSSGGLLSIWDGVHPVHLVGHSFGGNTALALTAMICNDFWGVGSDGSWVVSCTCVASPLAGCTLPFAFGYQAGGSCVHSGNVHNGAAPAAAPAAAAPAAAPAPAAPEACGIERPTLALRCFLAFLGTLEALQRRWPRLQLFQTRHAQWEDKYR